MKPNIIMIMTDQQRFDTIGAAGFKHMITPNIDKLANEGVIFNQSYCPGATCVASRAAIFTGMYPHNTGVYSFDRWCHQNTWVQDLADHGYHCVNLGKMHCDPLYDDCGFHERRVVENKTARFTENHVPEDEWGNYLLDHGIKRPNDRQITYPDWVERHNALEWEYDEKFHTDIYVGNMVRNWLEHWDGYKPLFLQIGFAGPHEPYDPPKKYLDLYENVDIPEAVFEVGELDKKPPQHKALRNFFRDTETHEAKIDTENATQEDIKRMRKHYYANVTMIDEWIGNIVEELDKKGLLQNSIIIFTSDHGDNLGDHRMPYKWVMYDTVTRVPLIIKDFREGKKSSTKIDELVSLMDIAPTVLEYAGIPIPSYLEGNSLQAYIKDGASNNSYKYVYCEDNYLIMMRSKEFKLVYYIGQEYGELYNLERDPWELDNLYDSEVYKEIKMEMKEDLLEWISKSNYFNGNYKAYKSKEYEMRWPDNDKFGYKLIGKK